MSEQENNFNRVGGEQASREQGPGQILEPEYLDEDNHNDDEIDPYLIAIKRLQRNGDSEALRKYLLSPEAERDMEEHIHIDGDMSMMLVLNHEAVQRGEPPPFSEEKMRANLRMHHEDRMATRAERDRKDGSRRDNKRLDEIRKSLGLPSGPNIKGALGPGEPERAPD